MDNGLIQSGVIHIMWKDIFLMCGIMFVVVYVTLKIMHSYVIKGYKKILVLYEKRDMKKLELQAKKILKISCCLAYGPKDNPMYFVYNGICWIFASISLMEEDEGRFLYHLGKMKKDTAFGLKFFVLALYWQSKGQTELALQSYNKFLKCKCKYDDNSESMHIVMNGIFNDKTDDLFYNAVNSFTNPAVIILFKRNNIIVTS